MILKEYNPLFPTVGTSSPLVLAGPCSAESEEQTLATAKALHREGINIFRAGVWKPRTRPGGFEGIGTPALAWLAKVKAETGMAIVTEVANARHLAEAVEAGIDGVWIGARTSANPFAVQEIADAIAALPSSVRESLTVLVKNPVSPDIELWIGALQRIAGAGVSRLGAIHRGFSSYGKSIYRNHPLWRIPIELHRRIPELPLICDPSHIGGSRELIAPLSQQALDMGFDGLIIESHCRPDCALSDAAQQITPDTLASILAGLEKPDPEHASTETLESLRREIDSIDDELIELLARRMRVAREIGQLKHSLHMPVVQPRRYRSLIESRSEAAAKLGLAPEFIRSVLEAIHEESVRQQINLR
ncbi:MAG: bifunctional 3-deoxy-7-phosphoheptulonate synthase/chorismate mutase type II [Bacteroidales bacterium]|nr:bifunctional 3-deoxy-7-phosphoheptulonate synthase/chorismate mutase type II [Bacteroidales bacterium]